MNMDVLIGKTMEETKDAEWFGFWPIINEDGVITGIVGVDDETDGLVPVDWKGGRCVPTTFDHGFDAWVEE